MKIYNKWKDEEMKWKIVQANEKKRWKEEKSQ